MIIPIDHENPCPNTNMILGAILAGASPAAVRELARQLADAEKRRAKKEKDSDNA